MILYILMRNDLASLNPGKAMAQAAHAANAFEKKRHMYHYNSPQSKRFGEWKGETSQGFGTTIVLAAPIGNIVEALTVASCSPLDEVVIFETIIDPTYPIHDGAATHLIPLATCAYIFCEEDSHIHKHLQTMDLHP